jgi:hypothetical protein
MPSARTSKISADTADTSVMRRRNTPRSAPAAGSQSKPPPGKTPPTKRARSPPQPDKDTPTKKLQYSDGVNDDGFSTPPNDTINFPDLTKPDQIAKTWTVAELKTMLEQVGEKIDGNKIQLVSRLVQHATVQHVDRLTPAQVPMLSDLQVASVLQSKNIPLSPDHAVRRKDVRRLIAARMAAPKKQPKDNPDPPPPPPSPPNTAADKLMQQRLDTLEQMLLALKPRDPRPAASAPDADFDVLSDSNDDEPAPASGPGSAELSLDKCLAKFASTLTSAFTEGFASLTDASGSSSTAATSLKLDRTHPAAIDPRKHGYDTHKYGLLIRRMIVVDYCDSGLTAITWKRSCKQQAITIHGLVHAGASLTAYNEGEALFITYVNECITLAVEYDKDAARYATLRTKQLGHWNESFNDMKIHLRQAARYMKSPDTAYRLQMEDIITTALEVGMSNAQIRNLRTTLKLRAGLGGDPCSDDDAEHSPRASSRHHSSQQAHHAGSPQHRDDARPKKKGAPAQPQSSAKPDATGKVTGERVPLSAAIVGASTPGAVPNSNVCNECGQGGTPETGHRKFECPRLFRAEWPNRSMPGFHHDGTRVPSAWNGENITDATRKQWLRMIHLGFFTRPSYSKDPSRVPSFKG